MEKKLCLFFNIASHYREHIYTLIDKEYNCDWFFGQNDTDINSFDISKLKYSNILKKLNIFKNKIIWSKGLSKLIGNKKYNTYLLTGDSFNLSIWWFLILHKIFYRKKRVYLWTHGWYGKETIIIKLLKKIYFGLADGIFLYGYYAKSLMIKEGIREDKLHVVHNSLQYEDQLLLRKTLKLSNIYKDYFKNENPVIIFIGRLTKVKRLDLLINVIANSKAKGKNYNLVFVGKGEEVFNLKELAKERKVIDNIWFYGPSYDEKQNSELLYNADLCVAPGNVGLTAIHSMMFGTPVLSHNNFPMQMPEFEAIKTGVTGGFFEYNNLDSIEKSIEEWFYLYEDKREIIRNNCYAEIDSQWNPEFQIKVLRENLIFE